MSLFVSHIQDGNSMRTTWGNGATSVVSGSPKIVSWKRFSPGCLESWRSRKHTRLLFSRRRHDIMQLLRECPPCVSLNCNCSFVYRSCVHSVAGNCLTMSKTSCIVHLACASKSSIHFWCVVDVLSLPLSPRLQMYICVTSSTTCTPWHRVEDIVYPVCCVVLLSLLLPYIVCSVPLHA